MVAISLDKYTNNAIKKGLENRVLFFFKRNKQTMLLVLLFVSLSFLCKLPKSLHLPNRIRNQLKKTLTKIPLSGRLRKVKSLNTVEIQTCFPEFLNVATNICFISFQTNKNHQNYDSICDIFFI